MLPAWTLISFHLLWISSKLKCEIRGCYTIKFTLDRKGNPGESRPLQNWEQITNRCGLLFLNWMRKNWMFSKILSWVLSVVWGIKSNKWAWCQIVFPYRWNKDKRHPLSTKDLTIYKERKYKCCLWLKQVQFVSDL